MLGDLVEDIIEFLVSDKVISEVKKGGCGCGKRKEKLNNFSKKYL